jgi:CelD/BcsL family acetyltransferase involved in cellulose biosynthesis
MNIAVTCQLGQDKAASLSHAVRVSRIQVFDDVVSAEPYWRWLERNNAWTSPYQRFDLLYAWQRHVGARKGVVPYVVVAFDGRGEPLSLWPLGRRRVGPLAVARFLGSKHASFNLGLWRRDLLGALGESEIRAVLAALAARRDPVDLLALINQPLHWAGSSNPFALLRHQRSAEAGTRLSLDGGAGVSASMRSRLRIKERKLKKLPGYRYLQARSAADIDRMLDAFFDLKAARMAEQGLPNVFAEPGVVEFVREASHFRFADGTPLIEIHALEGDGEVLALYGAITDGYRFSGMFNTYTLSDHSRHSPGLVLLQHMLAACVERGTQSFDLGVGRAHYKSLFCKEPEPLFDSFLPLTARGHLAAPFFCSAFAAKGVIKGRPALWRAVQFLRRIRVRQAQRADVREKGQAAA